MTEKTLFLAWQDKNLSRNWFPIGRLDVQTDKPAYCFRYTKGAERARAAIGFQALLDFPKLHRKYEASELFPLFRNRVMSSKRVDFPTYMRMHDLPESAGPIEALNTSGGHRVTDNYQVFPKIARSSDGNFRCRFFLHRSHCMNPSESYWVDSLDEGENLRVRVDAGRFEVRIMTEDHQVIGSPPRFLVEDMVRAAQDWTSDYRANVVRINPPPAPSRWRLLVEVLGHWAGYEPMSSSDYETLVQ